MQGAAHMPVLSCALHAEVSSPSQTMQSSISALSLEAEGNELRQTVSGPQFSGVAGRQAGAPGRMEQLFNLPGKGD